MTAEPGDRDVFSCRVIPERGSCIELVVSKKETLGVRIDQSGKFSAMTLLRAMEADYGSDTALLKLFYDVKSAKVTKSNAGEALVGQYAAEDVVYPPGHERCGEIICECCHMISAEQAAEVVESGLKTVEAISSPEDLLILNSVLEDNTLSHEEALLRIYQRLRPGNPPQLEKAIDLFKEKFFDVNRYRLGRVAVSASIGSSIRTFRTTK